MTRLSTSDHQRTVPADALAEFSDTNFGPIEAPEARAPLAVAMPLGVDLHTLADFKRQMAREGWPVQVARMIFDRVYAHERLAFGHSSANEVLRGLALELFSLLHAADDRAH